MTVILVFFTAFYLLIAGNLFATWFNYFKKYTNQFDRQRFSYLTTLVVGTIFWPIVVPIAYLSVLNKRQPQQDLF